MLCYLAISNRFFGTPTEMAIPTKLIVADNACAFLYLILITELPHHSLHACLLCKILKIEVVITLAPRKGKS